MTKRLTKKCEPTLELDLHGVQHHAVSVLVEDFVLNNQKNLPLKIITGNSEKMNGQGGGGARGRWRPENSAYLLRPLEYRVQEPNIPCGETPRFDYGRMGQR